MNLYEEVYSTANGLEKIRLMYIQGIQKIKENTMYTTEGKKKLTEEALKEYYEEVDKANNERITLMDSFIKLHTPKKENIQVKALN
uniref:hypothetical protein n=1 Tax=Fusobacterium sp. TaxID=68766 RepID=UPI002630EE32